MKIAIVYESKREEYRVKRIKRRLKRLGVSAAQVLLGIALTGAVTFACMMDSTDLRPIMRGFLVCVGLAAITYIGLRIEGR